VTCQSDDGAADYDREQTQQKGKCPSDDVGQEEGFVPAQQERDEYGQGNATNPAHGVAQPLASQQADAGDDSGHAKRTPHGKLEPQDGIYDQKKDWGKDRIEDVASARKYRAELV
jgi:hypothetical protein